ncbi:MAG: capsular polysaccharide biosynthesis protein [Chlorobiaceae bacterium]|nr:capsular polysaccharide biosynthesis protein [Chlorobiaceae bacterium]
MQHESCIGTLSRGILRIPFIDVLAGSRVVYINKTTRKQFAAVAGWGMKPSARRSRAFAVKHNLPYRSLEDGFLRSYGTGDTFPPLSIVLDGEGIYYDSTRPSDLETLLNGNRELLGDNLAEILKAKEMILEHRLSKYNHAPEFSRDVLRENDCKRILVVDQTAGDMSIVLGGAGGQTFAGMLASAREENPGATIYVKTHPEVISGRKKGHYTEVKDDESTVVLRDLLNPLSLVEEMDRVYVVSSTLGFEALLAGRPVTCFGMPWYAGWGVTDDRQRCTRRIRRRSVDELFSAAYFHYARYLDPVTRQQGTIFNVIDWLLLQRRNSARYPGRKVCVGYRRWKAYNIQPMVSLDSEKVVFVRDRAVAEKFGIAPGDSIVHWGLAGEKQLSELAAASGTRRLCMEDGFVRSVGLGSDLIPPLSLVLDERGIYFDPSRASDLEHILNTSEFTEEELAEAAEVRTFMVDHDITKYNIDRLNVPSWHAGGRRIVFVPGQVEDDASIISGSRSITTNIGLLQAVRTARPNAYIVFKPHPDVQSGNRKGKITISEMHGLTDTVESALSVVRCVESSDEVHTMTSLAGFDALLRGKPVVTYGEPFYAGWGLTEDMASGAVSFSRRSRQLTLDELVAGALLRYPIYWDRELKGYASCMGVLHRIRDERNHLSESGKLETLRTGYLRRQLRKLAILSQTAINRS